MQTPLTQSEAIRLREAFVAAVEAGDERRPSILRALRAESPKLAMMVDALLGSDDGPDGGILPPLDQPLLRLESLLGASAERPEGFPDFGARYAPLKLLGCGSAGDVYAAREREPIERDVAIKVFRPFRMGAVRRRRFETEARALAALADPGIARIFDSGVAADGRPFLVMELAPGEPIDEACRSANLDVRQRLEVIAKLCLIIQHAHQRGVIHRDLKPRNVLASFHDGTCTIKVIDFGLAKLAEEAGAPGRAQTMTGQVLGTFDYMSPEQFRGEPGDTRSDVYALGVLFVQLLTDRLPSEHTAAARAGTLPDDPAPVPMPELPAALRRDLETLAGHALAADPARRLASPAHVAEEIERVLSGTPILSRRTSARERLIRMMRRHPRGAAVVICVTAVVLTLAGAIVISRQQLAASGQELAAEVRTQRDMIASMLDEILDELEIRSGVTSMREALVPPMLNRATALYARHPEDPKLAESVARLLVMRGNLQLEHQKRAAARQSFSDAADLFEWVAGQSSASIETRRRHATAIIRKGDTFTRDNDETALIYFEQALALHEAMAADAPAHTGVLDDRSWSYHRLRALAMRQNQTALARQRMEERMASAAELLALDPDRTLSHFNMMSAHMGAGALHQRIGEHSQALADYTEAVRIGRELVRRDPDLLHYAITLMNAKRNKARSAAHLHEHRVTETAIDQASAIAVRLARENPRNTVAIESCIDVHFINAASSIQIGDQQRERRELALLQPLVESFPELGHAARFDFLESLRARVGSDESQVPRAR